MRLPNVKGITKRLPAGATAEMGIVIGLAFTAAGGGALLGFFLLNHPQAWHELLNGLPWMVVLVFQFFLSGRVQRLERGRGPVGSVVGPFGMLMADTKQAAMSVGHDEDQANAIAREVLATTVRRNGGWEP